MSREVGEWTSFTATRSKGFPTDLDVSEMSKLSVWFRNWVVLDDPSERWSQEAEKSSIIDYFR